MKNLWKTLAAGLFAAAFIAFVLGGAWGASYSGSEIAAGAACVCGAGFLNAALLALILDRIPPRGGGQG